MIRRALWLSIALVSLGCSTAPETPPPVKLYAFDCGRLNYDSVESLGIGDHETDVRDLIVPCYVIEHEKGRLLWEGGLPSNMAVFNGWQEVDGGWRMRLDQTFAEQLKEIDLTTADFDFMSFSHFHFDHIGVANEIEGAEVLIPRAEYDVAFASDKATPGYSPELYYRLKSGGTEPTVIDGEHDVFGDGRVRLIPAPGHTPGHQVLFLDLESSGPMVLAGDLYIFPIAREQRRVPPFNVNASQTLESMDRVEKLVETLGAKLLIGHDLAQFEQLPKPPQYLD